MALLFFAPTILSFFFISVSALQHAVSQLHCSCCYSNSWCMKMVITRWMWRGKSAVNRCCIRVSFRDQSDTISLSDIRCLPYINLQLPACQDSNVYLFSRLFSRSLLMTLPDWECLKFTGSGLFLYFVPILYIMSWHIFQLSPCSRAASGDLLTVKQQAFSFHNDR